MPRLLLSLTVLLVPALAHADSDDVGQAVEGVMQAVWQGAQKRIKTFPPEQPGQRGRTGIEYVKGGFVIKSIPREGGNRSVQITIPAARPNRWGGPSHLAILAERGPRVGGEPVLHVNIPVGRRGDLTVTYRMQGSETKSWLVGDRVSLEAADVLAQESGFTRRVRLPRDVRRVISSLRQVKGVPALDIANRLLAPRPGPRSGPGMLGGPPARHP
jgi:hypothetical protein